jgi:hypothetical protein
VFAVVIFGLYDPKTGSKLGLSGPKWCHKLGCNTLKPKPGSNLSYGPQNGVRIGLFTQKLDLWTAFGYTGFWVYGLFGSGAFGYTGFSVVTPNRQQKNKIFFQEKTNAKASCFFGLSAIAGNFQFHGFILVVVKIDPFRSFSSSFLTDSGR